MSAGTITLTNGSAIVGGTGTSFATELAAGDFIVSAVGGVPYTLPVKTVDSNTQVTLVSNFTGPTQSGAAWSAVPRVALNMVTAALVAQSAEALRGLNYDKQNWQSIFSGNGNVTVTLPDGTKWTGPAWNGIATTLSGKAAKGANDDITSLSGLTTALSLEQGGTGSTTVTGARKNLGLGTSATKDTGTTSNDVMQPGMFGLGRPDGALIFNTTSQDDLLVGLTGYGLTVLRNNAQIPEPWNIWNYSPTIFARAGDTYSLFSMPFQSSGKVRVFGGTTASGWTHSRILYDDKNTVVDSNGFIKQASPVVKIFTDGKYETNDESEGVTVTRLDVGQYLIEGCKALNSDAAWGGIDGGFEIPTDRNKQPLIWLDYEVNADGSVLVKTYHREHPSAPAFARNERDGLADGEPVDIPADQFVSVRVEMPADSIWNQKQAEEALKQEQGS
ncbi:TPA: phage tail protein [Enterobacter roggenkampii]|uniref:phage tail fiber protein n=2 Tax=Enterobacter roggenkampii TaxID=1812935 RepID=UPI001FF16F91|nr:phage tail protein [Enterobacter roggenkampii]UOZ12376.1 phage tail protein [Enterobacter roggenkampii]